MPLNSTSHKSILCTRFPYEAVLSGEEWHTITLMEELQKRGWHIQFMGSCPALLPEFEKRKISTYPVWGGTLPVSKKAILLFFFLWPFITCSLLWNFLILHKKQKISTVYMLSLTEKVLLTPWLLLFGIKVVWVEHQRLGKWIYLNPVRPLYMLWSRFVPVIGVSPMYRSQLQKLGVPARQLRIITNGIDTDFFSPDGAIWRPRKEGECRIGAVGRYSEDKGIDLLIRAVAEVKEKNPLGEFSLCLFGEGPMKDMLIALVKELHLEETVHFYTPYVDATRQEMPDFYRSLSVFVLPSRLHDPFGLVVAEAMAAGTPTIVTRVCGVAETLVDEKEALVIEENSVEALVKSLQKLYLDVELQVILRSEGRKKAVADFSLERMVAEFERVL